MATILEEFNALKLKIAAGKGNEPIHIVYHSQEKKRKLSPGKQTRFLFDCGTNETYRDIAKEYERILEQVKNVTIARHMVAEDFLESLKRLTPTEIAKKVFEGEGELPEWMR